ncbi:hypothetical protein C7401_13380 [Paraburkholderia unamae]|nr:hypothetical protein C7401_13380 [Paraburkholderia unamae]
MNIPMKSFTTALLISSAAVITAAPLTANALDIEARGVGTSAITGDINSVRTTALRQAKRRAVLAALDKVVGAGTSKNAAVQDKLDDLVEQIGENVFYDVTPSSADGQYQVSVTLRMDDKALRSEISDLGLALNTNTTRNQPILVMMDEFYTTPTDLHAPLEELTEFRHEAGNHYNEKDAAASSKSAAFAASSKAAYAARDRSAYATKDAAAGSVSGAYDSRFAGAAQNGYGDQAAVAARDSGRFDASGSSSHQAAGMRDTQVAAAASSNVAAASSSKSAYAHSVSSEDHDNTYYKKLVKYQPQNKGPDRQNLTYNALKGQLGDLDLNVIDNSLFRSKYFGNRAVTLDQLENSSELAKYVDFARQDASADYVMIGSSVIYDLGVDKNTGQQACTGVASTKTFSTRTGADIGSATESESSFGASSDDCRARLAGKLASSLGAQVGERIQNFVKKRSMYGAQYVVRLTGNNLSLMNRTAFTRAIKAVPGLEDTTQRQAANGQLEFVATYKGSDPLDQSIATALSSQPQFANLDSVVDGNVVTLCMDGCNKGKAVH